MGDSPVGMIKYAQQVQQRFNMTVPVFEDLIKQGMLEEKFRRPGHRRSQRRARRTAGTISLPKRKSEAETML